MRTLRRFGITVLVLTALLAGSGLAWAQTDDEDVIEIEDSEDVMDTLFNFGYDLVNRLFLWNLSALDGIYDCTLENGPLTATYGEATETGLVPVDNLEGDAGAVQFPNRPADQVADDLEPADSPASYAGADGDCGLSGGEVSGPNGQVNHGMFMKLFNSLYEGRGRGCVARHLAQSDLGRGDQQIQAGEDTDFESVEAGDTGTVEFTSAEADCEHGSAAREEGDPEAKGGSGSNGKPEDAGKPENAGKPDHAGKPEDAGKPEGAGKPDDAGNNGSPGNSGSAPGHNK